jgi:hypothetical protein
MRILLIWKQRGDKGQYRLFCSFCKISKQAGIQVGMVGDSQVRASQHLLCGDMLLTVRASDRQDESYGQVCRG